MDLTWIYRQCRETACIYKANCLKLLFLLKTWSSSFHSVLIAWRLCSNSFTLRATGYRLNALALIFTPVLTGGCKCYRYAEDLAQLSALTVTRPRTEQNIHRSSDALIHSRATRPIQTVAGLRHLFSDKYPIWFGRHEGTTCPSQI